MLRILTSILGQSYVIIKSSFKTINKKKIIVYTPATTTHIYIIMYVMYVAVVRATTQYGALCI